MGKAEAMPTLKDELDRKVLEAIEDLLVGFDNGKITDAQLQTGMHTLWTATAGLCDRDLMNLMSEAKPKHDPSLDVCAILFKRETGDQIVVRWNPGSATVQLVQGGKITSLFQEDEPTATMHLDARKRFIGAIQALTTTRGYCTV